MGTMSPQQRRGARETNFTDIGVAGRKTGLAVKDTGQRNEYGMEEMSAFFDSPDAPTPGLAIEDEDTAMLDVTTSTGAPTLIVERTTTEISMDVAGSSGIEPTAAITNQRIQRHSLPPRAQSPQRLAISGTARRGSSVAPQSSPIRHDSSSRMHHHSPMKSTPSRLLNFSSGNIFGSSGAKLPPPKLNLNGHGKVATTLSSDENGSHRSQVRKHIPEARSSSVFVQFQDQDEEPAHKVLKSQPKPRAKRGLVSKRPETSNKVFNFSSDSDDEDDINVPVENSTVNETLIDEITQKDIGMTNGDDSDQAAPKFLGDTIQLNHVEIKDVEVSNVAMIDEATTSSEDMEPIPKQVRRSRAAKPKAKPKNKRNPTKALAPVTQLHTGQNTLAGVEESNNIEPTVIKQRVRGKKAVKASETDPEATDIAEPVSKKQKAKGKTSKTTKLAEEDDLDLVPELRPDIEDDFEEPVTNPQTIHKKSDTIGTRKPSNPFAGTKLRGSRSKLVAIGAAFETTGTDSDGNHSGPTQHKDTKIAQILTPTKHKEKAAKSKHPAKTVESEPEDSKPIQARKAKSKARGKKALIPELREQVDADQSDPPKPKRRGRKAAMELEPEPDPAIQVEKEGEREGEGEEGDEETAPRPPKRGRPSLNTPKKSINSKRVSKINPPKARTKAEEVIDSLKSTRISPAPAAPATKRGQRIIREKPPTREASVDDEGKRRSNRSRVAPLAFWRNERISYVLDRSEVGPNGVAMPKLAEIIRVESDEETQSKPRRAGVKRKRDDILKSEPGLRSINEDNGIEEAGDTEVWENTNHTRGELGVKIGTVKPFPPAEDTDEFEEAELAYSKFRINAVSTASNDFKFVKTFTSSNFGTGVLEVPPGSLKRPKNSGKMNLVFYIVSGRATVEVADNDQFRIGAGGQVMIPRGNLYCFRNEFDVPLKMFFAQGCGVDPE